MGFRGVGYSARWPYTHLWTPTEHADATSSGVLKRTGSATLCEETARAGSFLEPQNPVRTATGNESRYRGVVYRPDSSPQLYARRGTALHPGGFGFDTE